MADLRWLWPFVWLGGATLGGLHAEEAQLPGDRIEATVTPAAPGLQLVRVSLPFPAGMVREGQGLAASDGQQEVKTGLRVLTWHPATGSGPRTARRALVTFPYRFAGEGPVRFTLRAAPAPAEEPPRLPVAVHLDGETLTVACRGGPMLKARLMAPARTTPGADSESCRKVGGRNGGMETRTEVVKSNAQFLWQRTYLPDPEWPRIVEVRSDALGGLVVVAHLQRHLEGDGRAPDFGWEVATGQVKDQKALYGLYRRPGDRDFARDYAEGQPGFGYSPPEGLVYFPEALAFYLKHRPASWLLTPAREDEPLGRVLARVPGKSY